MIEAEYKTSIWMTSIEHNLSWRVIHIFVICSEVSIDWAYIKKNQTELEKLMEVEYKKLKGNKG